MTTSHTGVTRTHARFPVYAALAALRELAGTTRPWTTSNAEQRRFTARAKELEHLLATIPELRAVASRDAADVNAFLRACGSAIQLQPWDAASDGCGAAGALDLRMRWSSAGAKSTLRCALDGASYPAAILPRKTVLLHTSRIDGATVAEVLTQGADRVFAAVADPAPDADLVAYAQGVRTSLRFPECGQLVLPMVDLDARVDLGWLLGLRTSDARGPLIISQALQQVRLRLNELGARAQSEAAVAARRGMGRSLTIDRPFLLWVERAGLPEPLLAAHVCPDSWKDPGTLDEPPAPVG